MNANTRFEAALSGMPVVAILRGVEPAEATSIGDALFRAGIRIIEVPLNSPEPLASIGKLADQLGESCVIGAGTVLTEQQVDEVVAAGGQLIVSPNTSVSVISRTVLNDAIALPGVATATEAFRAYDQGARYLKLFPAGTYGAAHVKALSAVLPGDAKMLAVGGVGTDDIAEWMQAGIHGVGMGSELYRPGDNAATVFDKAAAVVNALQQERKHYEAV